MNHSFLAEGGGLTRCWAQMWHLAEPRQRLRPRIKHWQHQVGLLLAVCLGVQHAEPLGSDRGNQRDYFPQSVTDASHWINICTHDVTLSHPSWTTATMPSTFKLPCSSTQKFGLLPATWLAEGSSSSSSVAPAPTSSMSESIEHRVGDDSSQGNDCLRYYSVTTTRCRCNTLHMVQSTQQWSARKLYISWLISENHSLVLWCTRGDIFNTDLCSQQ